MKYNQHGQKLTGLQLKIFKEFWDARQPLKGEPLKDEEENPLLAENFFARGRSQLGRRVVFKNIVMTVISGWCQAGEL